MSLLTLLWLIFLIYDFVFVATKTKAESLAHAHILGRSIVEQLNLFSLFVFLLRFLLNSPVDLSPCSCTFCPKRKKQTQIMGKCMARAHILGCNIFERKKKHVPFSCFLFACFGICFAIFVIFVFLTLTQKKR